jgi:PAS domain S-box-containing protein
MTKLNSLLERALNTAKIGFWTLPSGQSNVELSENAREVFCFPSDQRLVDIVEFKNRFASQDDQSRFAACLEEVQSKLIQKSGIFQIVCPDSGEIKWIRCIGQPDIEDGVCKAVFGSFQDITDRIVTEHKLAENERRYKLITENTSDGIIIIDKRKVTFASPGFLRLMRYKSFDEYIKSTKGKLKPVIHPDDIPRIKKKYYKNLKKQVKSAVYQFRALTGDGDYIWREDRVDYEFGSDGALLKTYAVCRDITDRKRNEEKLKGLIDEKQRLISTIVHDIRNPISASVSLNSVLLEELDDEEHIELVEAANCKLEFALHLASELLDLSSMESKYYKLTPDSDDLKMLFDELESSFHAQAQELGILLWVETDENLPKVSFNIEKLRRALNNLVSNSLKFTDRGGTVRITATNKSDHILITVTDTGIGIPKDYIHTLFQKFTKAKRMGLHGEESTGLGMSITKQIIDLHKGSISVKSKEGRGTTFYVRLPK